MCLLLLKKTQAPVVVVVVILTLPASPICFMHASSISVDMRSAANVITITPSIDISFVAGANP